jgi:hypothetical protein
MKLDGEVEFTKIKTDPTSDSIKSKDSKVKNLSLPVIKNIK